jgi:hypothetical protein
MVIENRLHIDRTRGVAGLFQAPNPGGVARARKGHCNAQP